MCDLCEQAQFVKNIGLLTLNPWLCVQTAPSSAPQTAALSTQPVPTRLSRYESHDIFFHDRTGFNNEKQDITNSPQRLEIRRETT